MKTRKRQPVYIGKALTFEEMIQDAQSKAQKTEAKWQKDHLCTASNCKNTSTIDLSLGSHLCEKCKKELDRLLTELGAQ